jgi:hypothetical protein
MGTFVSCFSKVNTKRQVEFARITAEHYMKHADNLYHTMEHIDDVVTFVRLVFESIRNHKYTNNYTICCTGYQDNDKKSRNHHNIRKLETVLILAAYFHDLGHPMNESREQLELLVRNKSAHFNPIMKGISSELKTINIEGLHAELCRAECGNIIHEGDMLCILELIKSTNLQTYSTDHDDIGKTIIRCADLSNFTFSWEKHQRSKRKLCNELKIYISPKDQMDFIEIYVLPQFRLMHSMIKTQESKAWILSVCDNLSMWNHAMMTESTDIYQDRSVHIGELIYEARMAA